jgi:hypothetical protein
MAVTTTIPVEIAPDAAARVAELGMQRELEQMLEHTRQAVPGLVGITVTIYEHPDEEGQPHVAITGWKPGAAPSGDDYRPESEWRSWFARAFPPDVLRWFSFWLGFKNEHSR